MLSSYQFAERVNAQSLLWDCCCLGFAVIRKTAGVVGRVPRLVSHFTYILWAMAMLTWPDVMALVRGVAVVASWGALIAMGLGLVVFVLAHPAIIVGAGIIAAYAWMFKPRTAVRK